MTNNDINNINAKLMSKFLLNLLVLPDSSKYTKAINNTEPKIKKILYYVHSTNIRKAVFLSICYAHYSDTKLHISALAKQCKITRQTASATVKEFEDLGLVCILKGKAHKVLTPCPLFVNVSEIFFEIRSNHYKNSFFSKSLNAKNYADEIKNVKVANTIKLKTCRLNY
tara:strand:+ start:229 stop:735 length:507 start_codon:yes stop_codon:yes gene_type:complete